MTPFTIINVLDAKVVSFYLTVIVLILAVTKVRLSIREPAKIVQTYVINVPTKVKVSNATCV